jgi:hypothetical protein
MRAAGALGADMTPRRASVVALGTVLMLALAGWLPGGAASLSAEKLPSALTNQEFWKLATDFSEPDGTFHSENLVSNEARFQSIVPNLVKAATAGRAYVGVGSEQNFTYIAATKPAVAFIVDIRRGNLDLHLLYKAFFELSVDRAEFISRVFARPRPAGLGPNATAAELFSAYAKVAPSQTFYDQNLKAAETQLVTKHGFALSAGDKDGLAFVYNAWFKDGPNIHYELNGQGGARGGGRGGPGGFPTYADLMTATDEAGVNRSYLGSEASFKFLKDLETRNMVVPVVGNFGGPKALRAVASYLKQKELVVSTFYASNVEQYLRQDGIWDNFCASVATMPLDQTSTFVHSARAGFGGQPGFGGRGFRGGGPGGGFDLEVVPIEPQIAACKR